MHVSDLDDPRLDPFRDLRTERDRRDDPWFVCESTLCVKRALESPHFTVETLLTTTPQLETLKPLLAPETVVLEASNQLLHEIIGFKFHRGCIATVKKPVVGLPDFEKLGARSRVVFAEAVSNPSNMGSLIRNCRSFGVDLLVYTESSGDPFSRHAVRTGMGNVFSQPLACVDDLADAIRAYRHKGAAIFAATLGEKAVSLRNVKPQPHTAIVLGNEKTGLLPSTIAAATHEVTIPMDAGADSLNVAAASAVFLYALHAV